MRYVFKQDKNEYSLHENENIFKIVSYICFVFFEKRIYNIHKFFNDKTGLFISIVNILQINQVFHKKISLNNIYNILHYN